MNISRIKSTLFTFFVIFQCFVFSQSTIGLQSSAAPTASNFTYPQSVFVDSESGHIWVTDFDNNRVMRFDVSGLTSVSDKSGFPPQSYRLEQNFPNPFNPETQIQFTLQSPGFASLKVYDLLGKEIATVVYEIKNRGNYTVSFNAARLPSGVYFYTLRSGQFVETKRMILMK